MGKSKVYHEDILLIDPYFPGNSHKGFRGKIVISLFNDFPSAKSYFYALNYPPGALFFKEFKKLLKQFINLLLGRLTNMPGNNIIEYHLGITKHRFNKNKGIYSSLFPEHANKICFLDYHAKYKARLAYMIFLNVTYQLLPFLEKNKIPFIFILFPGGGFGINNHVSDKRLSNVFKSSYFRKVVVSNKYVENYLISKNLCQPEQIYRLKYKSPFISFERLRQKLKYPKDKSTFDLVFVAYKYMPKGLDKGYDLFIDTAKRLSKNYDAFRFHVVGNWTHKEIDITKISEKITFHGVRDTNFLVDLYSRMDIFLSPNRPFILGEGKFDGFPLGGHALFCGVALFVTDELNLNEYYEHDEIVIIRPDLNDIVSKIEYYYNRLDELYKLSAKGQAKLHSMTDVDKSRKERISFFQDIISNEPKDT
jgi:glycosyltransferase involved in cell wall biosynthesis